MNTDLNTLHTVIETSPLAATAERTPSDNVVAIPSRRSYRARDMGVGYGRSSGYALDKRYTTDWGALRFRCA
jgi:hypothetical protein